MKRIDHIVLATGNKGKVAEFASLFENFAIKVSPQSEFAVPDVPETGTTFVENAIIKARHACVLTGLPSIADDSGLAVDALGGAPGIYSSRYAQMADEASDKQDIRYTDADNKDSNDIDRLLHDLDLAAQTTATSHQAFSRNARFLCVLVFMRHKDDPTPLICQGEWHGEIAYERHGDGGFGYDPVFWLAAQNCSAAELDKATKNIVSHRGIALKELLTKMQRELKHELTQSLLPS